MPAERWPRRAIYAIPRSGSAEKTALSDFDEHGCRIQVTKRPTAESLSSKEIRILPRIANGIIHYQVMKNKTKDDEPLDRDTVKQIQTVLLFQFLDAAMESYQGDLPGELYKLDSKHPRYNRKKFLRTPQ